MKLFFLIILLFPLSLFAQKQGQALVDSMLKQLPQLKEDTNKVKLFGSISFEYRKFNPDEGIKYGKEGVALAEKLGWKKGIADCANCVGINYMSKSDFTNALEYYFKALKLNEELGLKKVISSNLNNIGCIYNYQSDYNKASEYYLKALTMDEEYRDTAGIFSDLNNLGLVYHYQGNYSQALDYFFKAIKISERINRKDMETTTLTNIGLVFMQEKDYNKALEYYYRSIEIGRQTGDSQTINKDLSNIGLTYKKMGDFSKAEEYYKQALSLSEKLNNKYGIAIIFGNLAAVCLNKKDYKNTLAYYQKSAQLFEEMGQKSGLAQTQNGMGVLYMEIAKDSSETTATKRSSLQKAIGYLSNAIKMHSEMKNIKGLLEDYTDISDAWLLYGNTKLALENYKQYVFYKDSVFSSDSKTKIAKLEHQRELDLKESQIKLLEQENKIQELNAHKEKLIRKVMAGGIIMIIILAGMMAMYFVRKQQHEKLVAGEKINTLLKDQELRSVSDMLDAQEGERKRIASELHDRLGSMLSTVKLYFNSVEEQIDVMKEQNRSQYHKATSLLDEACDEVRKISHDLVSGELVKFGLVPALSQLKETIENTGKLKMEVLAFGMEKRLEGNVEISLYRVVQELMNNILKHSKADKVTIQLNKVENNLNIVVEDNGVGFDVVAARLKGGMGLKNLESRINKLSGTISIDSGRGRGTTTIIDIPV